MPTYREILTQEELDRVLKLQSEILHAKSNRQIKKIRKEINSILETAKARYQSISLGSEEQASSTEIENFLR